MVGQFDIGLRSLLTTHSNEVTGDLHNRMPLILAERDWARWLGEESASSHELLALLIPMRC
jgi:putative SOS response-associated peptidase YedK